MGNSFQKNETIGTEKTEEPLSQIPWDATHHHGNADSHSGAQQPIEEAYQRERNISRKNKNASVQRPRDERRSDLSPLPGSSTPQTQTADDSAPFSPAGTINDA